MTTKFQRIADLAEVTMNDVIKNKESWKKYLNTAATLYKYPFDEQLLIYAQRPDATAVASIQFWNQKAYCWVNKGSKGIALIDKEKQGANGLKYVFNIGDVHEGSQYTKKPKLWEFKLQYETEVIEALQIKFNISREISLDQNLINLAEDIAQTYCKDYEEDFLEELKSTVSFNELDNRSIKVLFKDVLAASIGYTILTRCGFNTDVHEERLTLEGIVNFESVRALAQLGTANGELSKSILIEIEKTVRKIEKNLVNNNNMEYNALKRKSGNGYTDTIIEGGNEDGSNIQTGGRLSNSEYRSERPGGSGDNRQIWNNEKKLSDDGEESQIQWDDTQRRTESTPFGNRQTSNSTDGDYSLTNDEATGDNGSIEGIGSDGMGSGSKQYQSTSGRDSVSRIDLHLDLIKKILRDDVHMLIKQEDIISFYLQETDAQLRTEFIKDAYNKEYSLLISNGQRVGYLKEEDGLLLWEGNYITRSAESKLSWEKVESLFSDMIEEHEYLNINIELNHEFQEERVENENQQQLSLFPSITQQKDAIDILARNAAPFSNAENVDGAKYSYLNPKTEEVPKEYIVSVLKRGTGFQHGRFCIEKIYKNVVSSNERIKAIKKEFGQGGAGWPIEGYGLHGYDTFKSKGLRFQWKDAEGEKEGYVSWTVIEKALGELLRNQNYITQDERYRYNKEQSINARLELINEGEIITVNGEPYEFVVKDLYGRIEVKPLNENNELYFTVDEHCFIDHYNLVKYDSGIGETSSRIVEPSLSVEGTSVLAETIDEVDLLDPDEDINDKQTDTEQQTLTKKRINFTILNDELGKGGAKEKFNYNIKAIKTLQLIEKENRIAIPEEQLILSEYVGWGGLSQVFDENNSAWTKEYMQLKDLLSPEEYIAARESTLNAFYTQPQIVKAMYDALYQMGFKSGNILEPSMGVGNFFGMLPEEMKQSKLFGVELDSISGRIGIQLYQNAKIIIDGFERTELPDNFFDVAIGNVPFGQYKVYDKKYDKQNFLIHDYFFAKTLDKVRPGGVIAFISSKGTMDKANGNVRKYIAQRAELLGAIRLPNNAFSANAGTSVTSDIMFLQKRDRMIDVAPDWVYLDTTEEGLNINSYFVTHPHMVLGQLSLETGQYGKEDIACLPISGKELKTQLETAIRGIKGEVNITKYVDFDLEDVNFSIPANQEVRNYSYTLENNKIYFRENSTMRLMDLSEIAENRVRGMIEIRDCARSLIDLQVCDYSDEAIQKEQKKLSKLYDKYTNIYGLLSSRGNSLAFREDASYPLLTSLEILDDKGNLVRKADMFTQRTIRSRQAILSVDTAGEALAVSIGEKAKVDIDYMSKLTGMGSVEIIGNLRGVIYKLPESEEEQSVYVTADEYLSGNIRTKLLQAKIVAESNGDVQNDYLVNIKALEDAMPKALGASEIDVRLGATWVPEDIINNFMHQLMDASNYVKNKVTVKYSNIINEWVITNKNTDSSSVKATSTYGTKRISAYKIIEDTLNLKDVSVTDIIEQDGKEKRVLNKKETTIAQQKQEVIKSAFSEWVWENSERRERLAQIYNEKFNSVRPREYDGSHIILANMNPEIRLEEHQINAVARVLYGGNTLLAHTVGAGKTFEMIAAAQESKRLGLCNKSLFVVPNHLIEQWASEYLRLYPSANILVTTKKDFEKSKRKRFCSRIATGEYDAVIMGHSQFEKIPMSEERQEAVLNMELEEILAGIEESKRNNGDNLTVKQLERVRKTIQLKLDKLHDTDKKDDIVNFEELGIDRVFIDEAHYFKNLFLYTKMRNVAGISQTEANKSSDLFMKSRYIDEITGGRGLIFATGTPISNSMTEMYTMQRYLQYKTLEEYGLQHFDAWASTFGETVTAIELPPEGSGYRAKTRFAKFFNLPELMTMFKEVADIKTADMLNLEVPEAEFKTIVLKPSEYQQEFVKSLSIRADQVRNKLVEPNEDNMLKITNDGRKLALDQRLMDDSLPDSEGSKTNACADNVFEIWKESKNDSLTQLVFCDISTPHFDGSFNVYDDIKSKLMGKGVPEDEIAFIHSAKTDKQKDDLFAKVRNGQVRVLMGSTQKMGAGTNIQDKLIALHDLDCPWRPSDLEQRLGRIVRRGNLNDKVKIFRYVTENTFDSYLYQLVENKQKFIGQIMTSKSPVRSAEDIDEATLSYAEIKALATGNPMIKEKMDLEVSVSRLKVLRTAYLNNKYSLEDSIRKKYPEGIKLTEEKISKIKADIITIKKNQTNEFEGFTINNVAYEEKEAAGNELLNCISKMSGPEQKKIGNYKGFDLFLTYDSWNTTWEVILKAELSYRVKLGKDVFGNITRIDNAFVGIPKQLEKYEEEILNLNKQMGAAKEEINKPFQHEAEFKDKSDRLAELDIILNLDEKPVDGEIEKTIEPERKGFDIEKIKGKLNQDFQIQR